MSMSRLSILLGGQVAASLVLSACLSDKSFFVPFEASCLNNGGDSYCAEQDPSTPYCVAFEGSCYEDHGLEATSDEAGCVAQMPEDACWAPCGLDDTCGDTVGTTDGSSGGETEEPSTSTTEAETETETEDPSTTTGPECSEALPCVDEAAPFCVDGECLPCTAVVDGTPDEACAMLDEATPLCVEDVCVQCTGESAEACGGTTPLCDEGTNTCVGCSFHEECQGIGSPACNIETGACFDPAAVTEVNLAGANALQNAVDAVADGAEHAIVVTGSVATNHSATIDGGKVVAIVSANTSVQTVSGAASPIITVNGAGSTAYLHRLRIDGSNGVGISVGPAGTLYADSTQVSGNDGGGISLATGSSGFLRNCMVAGAGGDPGLPAVAASAADVEVLFSTLGLAFNNGGPVLECSGGAVSVRNSIVASDTSMVGTAMQCPGAMVVNSGVESDSSADSWFGDIASADFFLTPAGQTLFADIATWEEGDPPFDFEGDARPAVDGAADYAGADEP